jgi:hypothetical protein
MHVLAVALALAASANAGDASAAGALAGVDRDFVCPEQMPSDAARMAALKAFMENVAKATPDASVLHILEFRRALLEKHHCERTLQNMQQADARVLGGAVLDQPWLPINGPPRAELYVSAGFLRLYIDPRRPTEHAVETFVRTKFPAPAETNVTHVRYDEVVSHNVYYCQSHAYALVQNDYFLGGREVLKDPSPPQVIAGKTVYEIDPVPPGSFNELASRAVCASEPGSAA